MLYDSHRNAWSASLEASLSVIEHTLQWRVLDTDRFGNATVMDGPGRYKRVPS